MSFSFAMRTVSLFFLKLVFIWPVKLIIKLINHIRDRRYDANIDDYADDSDKIGDERQHACQDNKISYNDEVQDAPSKYDNLPEMPEMCQIFPIDDDTCIGVQFVDMCPDETAHIRVIGDTTFSQIYKRRVYREKTHEKRRYFMLNGERYFLRPDTTQPIDPVQAKEGK